MCEWVHDPSLSLTHFMVLIFRANRTWTDPNRSRTFPYVISRTRIKINSIQKHFAEECKKELSQTHACTFFLSSFFHNIIQFQEKQCNQTHAVNISLCRCLFPSLSISCRILSFFLLTNTNDSDLVSLTVCLFVYAFVKKKERTFYDIVLISKIYFTFETPSLYSGMLSDAYWQKIINYYI